MKKDYVQAMMNPVKLRIMQLFLISQEWEAKQMADKLPDVPVSSLYRHLGELTELGVLCVVAETPMRGAVKKTYALNKAFTRENPSGKELSIMMQAALCQITGELQEYFGNEDVNLQRDCVNFENIVIHIGQKDFIRMREEILQILKKYAEHLPEEGDLVRRISLIASPVEREEGEEKK